MTIINIKSQKRCAFCDYWYDPANTCISPKNARINLWEYDTKAKCTCLQKNIKLPAGSVTCPKYKCKVPII